MPFSVCLTGSGMNLEPEQSDLCLP